MLLLLHKIEHPRIRTFDNMTDTFVIAVQNVESKNECLANGRKWPEQARKGICIEFVNEWRPYPWMCTYFPDDARGAGEFKPYWSRYIECPEESANE